MPPKTYHLRKVTSTSREDGKCPVEGCKTTGRVDKLKEHFRKTVVWDDQSGNAVSADQCKGV